MNELLQEARIALAQAERRLCLRVRRERGVDPPSFWWADVQPDVRCYLGLAPADVRARALAAFGKLGLRVD